jgi:hypothetical protein
MGSYVMVAQSRAKPGRDDEYNEWYDTTHLPDMCAIPGVKSGRRFEATPISMGQPGLLYLAIYELEADDPSTIMAEMGKRFENGTIRVCDALDAEASVLWIYKTHQIRN